ncbi:MAG: transcriptional regulator [Devosia sp.]|jgi:DNA-binding MltR family transcriptional regulator|nr:transcriptional regulator [Devosia sp.]
MSEATISDLTDQFDKYSAEFMEETERGIALLAISMLDLVLTELIRNFLADVPSSGKLLDGFNAPLGTFASRVEAAHAFGLISDEEASDIHLMRKIRNEFAHSFGISFSDPAVKSRVDALQFSKAPHRRGDDETSDGSVARNRFSHVAILLNIRLISRAKLITRLTVQHWFFYPESVQPPKRPKSLRRGEKP